MEYNLERFITAQERDYAKALKEITEGKKRTHWMWYIFPQLKGLGQSTTSEFYGIDGIEEAIAYYKNEYLKNHLIEISKVLLLINDENIESIMGYPDDLKLHSCMTLFNKTDPTEKTFQLVLEKFYNNELDENTLNLIKETH